MALDPATTEALAALQELPLPPPISYRPQTIGWVLIGALMLVATVYVTWRWWRRWQANAYRREALRAMADVERRLASPETHTAAAHALPALVKRTALACTARERVARLSEDEWLAFLDRTCPPGGFAAGPGRWLPRLAYEAGAEPSALELNDLTRLVRRWIEKHDALL
jgi:uncharacterized protein DUF4381